MYCSKGNVLRYIEWLQSFRSIYNGRSISAQQSISHVSPCVAAWPFSACLRLTSGVCRQSSQVGAFINLESTGPGGPDILFQASGTIYLMRTIINHWWYHLFVLSFVCLLAHSVFQSSVLSFMHSCNLLFLVVWIRWATPKTVLVSKAW